MRASIVGFVLLALATPAPGDPHPLSANDGKYAVKFPGVPKVTSQTAKTKAGELTIAIATYANADGNTFMVSWTDYPTGSTVDNQKQIFDGIRDGIKGNGKIVGDEKNIAFGEDKLPGREFVVDKGGRQRVKFRAILRDGRLYQIAAIGTETFVSGKDVTAFFDSFELIK